MPRSNRQRRRGRPRVSGTGDGARGGSVAGPLGGTVRYAGQQWSVRAVRGNDSGRTFVCPGCQQPMPATEPHTVAWPEDAMQGVDNRRHWHNACWSARERRRPGGSFA